jgi:hypothetical protein
MADTRHEYRVEIDQDLWLTFLLTPEDATAFPNPDTPPAPTNPATGATAGIPGTWTPASSTPPNDPASCHVTASPASAWTTGQFVQTLLAGAAGRCCWSGTNWVGGIAP